MTPQEQVTKRWLLNRLRIISSGMSLVRDKINEIGIELAEDKITPEMAVRSVTALEEMPLYHIAHIFSPGE